MASLDWPTILTNGLITLIGGIIVLVLEHRTNFFSEQLRTGKAVVIEKQGGSRDWTIAVSVALQNFKKQNRLNWFTHDVKVEEISMPNKGLRRVVVAVVSKVLESNNLSNTYYEIMIDRSGEIHQTKRIIANLIPIAKAISKSNPINEEEEFEDFPAIPKEPDFREENIKRLFKNIAIVFLFAFTYFLLWFAFYLPLAFFIGLRSTVDLNTIKIIGWFSDAIVPVKGLGWWALFFSTLLYLPTLIMANYLSSVFAKKFSSYIPVDTSTLYILHISIVGFIFFLLAGVVTYIISDLSLWCSCCIWPMLIIMVLGLIAGGKSTSGNSTEQDLHKKADVK